MIMTAHKQQQGQSLLEIIFAISIFVIGVVTIGYLTIDAFTSMQRVTDSTQARLLAAEGIDALVSIKDNGFEKIVVGSHGLVFDGGFWTLTPTADEKGKFTRIITIENIDSDVLKATSLVTWSVFGGRERSVSYSTLLSNWSQTKGEAGSLNVSTQNASLISFGTELIGIFLQNDSTEDITITDVAISWNTQALLSLIEIEGIEVFNASTSQAVISGTKIDIEDYTIEANSGFHQINSLLFDASVSGSNLIIIFTLGDGSTRSIYLSP
jgi:hypothetical protein